jgi:hypothetical protein
MRHLLPTKDRDLVKTLSYGLLPLGLLLLGLCQSLFSFLALFSADLAAFLAETLAMLALSQASLDAFSSASRADMRA